MKIKKLPNVLALHLKRFKYQEDVGKYIKLAYRVAFPLELRLFNTVDDAQDPDRLYELFAIVVHIGKYVIFWLSSGVVATSSSEQCTHILHLRQRSTSRALCHDYQISWCLDALRR